MLTKPQNTERRKHKRYKAKNGAIAALMENSRLGQILDVSQGGLSFRYIEDENGPTLPSELKILMPETGFFLERLAFKTISDFPVERNLPFRSIQMRQSGLQFLNLNAKQEFQLRQFLHNHTMGFA